MDPNEQGGRYKSKNLSIAKTVNGSKRRAVIVQITANKTGSTLKFHITDDDVSRATKRIKNQTMVSETTVSKIIVVIMWSKVTVVKVY
jgi:hypothetical protein